MKNILRSALRFCARREPRAEAAEAPKDFLIPDPDYRDAAIGFGRFIIAWISYWVLGGWRPLPLRMQIESANIRRQIGPARLRECREWLEADPMEGEDLFQGL